MFVISIESTIQRHTFSETHLLLQYNQMKIEVCMVVEFSSIQFLQRISHFMTRDEMRWLWFSQLYDNKDDVLFSSTWLQLKRIFLISALKLNGKFNVDLCYNIEFTSVIQYAWHFVGSAVNFCFISSIPYC